MPDPYPSFPDDPTGWPPSDPAGQSRSGGSGDEPRRSGTADESQPGGGSDATLPLPGPPAPPVPGGTLPLPAAPISGGTLPLPAAPVSGGTKRLPARAGSDVAPLPATARFPAPLPVIAEIAEIQVTSASVRTPTGEFPLRGSRWVVTDHWLREEKTPTWAVVLAILGFCVIFVFSLLFLLIKQTRFHGWVQVVVSNGPHQYVARIPVTSQAQVQHLYNQVNYVRSLAAL